jgi:hypothetical protein
MSAPASPSWTDRVPADVVQFFLRWSALPKIGLMPRLSDYLDEAPPELQPNVTIVDVLSPTEMIVRLFGTGLEEASGLYPTAQSLRVLYGETLWPRAQKLVWAVVTHPVGYVCVRRVRTSAGLIVDCPAIGLPIGVDMPGRHCFITYANVSSASQELAPEENFELVQDLEFLGWIDLGAGVPAKSLK